MKIILKAGYKFWAVSKRRQRKSLSLLVPFSPVSKHIFRTAATQCHNFIFLQTDRYMPNLVTISTDIREQAQVLYLPCSCDTFITLHNRLRQHKALLGWNVLREDELLFMEFYSLFFFNLITQQEFNLTCGRLSLKYTLCESLETAGTEFTFIESVPVDLARRDFSKDGSACISWPPHYRLTAHRLFKISVTIALPKRNVRSYMKCKNGRLFNRGDEKVAAWSISMATRLSLDDFLFKQNTKKCIEARERATIAPISPYVINKGPLFEGV